MSSSGLGLPKFELFSRAFCCFAAGFLVNPHSGELGVGDRKDPHFSSWWYANLNTFLFRLNSFSGGAVSAINRELEHRESFIEKEVTELSVVAFVDFCVSWQVEHDEHPHGSPLADHPASVRCG